MTKVIFLDRDGVINRYPGDTRYVTTLAGFRFLPGVKKALQKLSARGYTIFIISNQAGVSKGVFSQKSLDTITNHMLQAFSKAHVSIAGVYYCTHRSQERCGCRKPKDGLMKKALKEHGIPKAVLKDSFFIGDTIRDVQAGTRAGCKTILVFSGKEKPHNSSQWLIQPDFTAKDLYDSLNIIVRHTAKFN